MIIRDLLRWMRTASAADRADAASALARAYLYSDLDADDREAAEAAMTVLLDDASPLVRAALADALAAAHEAPRHLVLALAGDQPEVAGLVLARSPLLIDAELVDAVARGDMRIERAVAERRPLSRAVAAAIAEVGTATGATALLGNDSADVAVFSLARIAERHGDDGVVREALLARRDVPPAVRQRLARRLAGVLGDFLGESGLLPRERALGITAEAVDRATVTLADTSNRDALSDLVGHLIRSGELTPALLLRGVCAGNIALLAEALAQLAGLDGDRAHDLCIAGPSSALDALFRKARVPEGGIAVFRAALSVWVELGLDDRPGARAHFSRRMLERVLTRYEGVAEDDSDHLLLMLRRFAAEAARIEARAFTEAYAADVA